MIVVGTEHVLLVVASKDVAAMEIVHVLVAIASKIVKDNTKSPTLTSGAFLLQRHVHPSLFYDTLPAEHVAAGGMTPINLQFVL